MSGEVDKGARIMQRCVSTVEQSIVSLIEIGDDERAERCKEALAALVGADFGDEYAYRTVAYAIEMTGRDLDEYERRQRQHEISSNFGVEVERIGPVGDFLNACEGDSNDEAGM